MTQVIKVRSVDNKPDSVIVLDGQAPKDPFDALADSQAVFYHFRSTLPTATFNELVKLFEEHGRQARRGLW